MEHSNKSKGCVHIKVRQIDISQMIILKVRLLILRGNPIYLFFVELKLDYHIKKRWYRKSKRKRIVSWLLIYAKEWSPCGPNINKWLFMAYQIKIKEEMRCGQIWDIISRQLQKSMMMTWGYVISKDENR